MDRGGLVVNLQYKSLLTLAINLLVHNLDVLEAATVCGRFVFDWDGELIFESG